jgi:hypothetical protein
METMRFVFQKFGVLWLIILLYAAFVQAQPGPSEEEKKEIFLHKALKEIKELDTKILSSRVDAKLYNERGALYLELFLKFGAAVEHKNVVYKTEVDEKSITDLDIAVNLDPQAEYFCNRGRFYQKRWLDDVGALGFEQIGKWWNKDLPAVSWQIIESKFFKNNYFNAAESDYIDAVKRAEFHKPKNNYDYSPRTLYGDNYLIPLYYKRAYTLMYNSALSKTVAMENKEKLVYEDWSKYINYYHARVGTENEMVNDSTLLELGHELMGTAFRRLKNK